MPTMRYIIMRHQGQETLSFVEMPATHAYQLSALNLRLHKELDKLTADNIPELPYAVAECDNLELHARELPIIGGLDYLNQLEQQFAQINEQAAYPLIALLTEIRALQAQLEQWYEEELDLA